MGKTPTFSEHAELQMVKRGISRAEALLTIRQPDSSKPSYDNSMNYWKYLNGRTIRVTVATDAFDPNQPRIVTVAIKETT